MGRLVAGTSALLGGVCWVLGMFVAHRQVEVIGALLLAVAVAVTGAGLVRQLWLRVVAGLGAVALAASLVAVARDAGDPVTVEGVTGGLATFVVALAVLRRPRRHPGNH